MPFTIVLAWRYTHETVFAATMTSNWGTHVAKYQSNPMLLLFCAINYIIGVSIQTVARIYNNDRLLPGLRYWKFPATAKVLGIKAYDGQYLSTIYTYNKQNYSTVFT